MSDSTLRFGANYTPRIGWFHSWLDFDPSAVAADLDALADLGLDHIRIFPLWPILQPNRTLIRPNAIADVVKVVELAHQRGLKTWVDGFQGHLSSYDFLPSWTQTWHQADLFLDPKVRLGQVALLKELAGALRETPGAAGMCVGNEFPQFAAGRHPNPSACNTEQAHRWLIEMFAAISSSWPTATGVHSFDDDLWFDHTHPFTPQLAVECGQLTTVHSWVFSHVGPKYGQGHIALVRFARYLLELANAWQRHVGNPDRPIWLQEVGAPSTCVPAADAASFLTDTVQSALGAANLWGITWWCSHDVSRNLADFPELEYSLGLFDSAGNVKPIGLAFKEIIKAIRAGEDLAVCRSSRGTDTASTIAVPADPAARHLVHPAGEIFAQWLDSWERTGACPTLEVKTNFLAASGS